ncbi:MAG: tetratricopeptide repeat protein, partial [Planctomycetaceae bacterium]
LMLTRIPVIVVCLSSFLAVGTPGFGQRTIRRSPRNTNPLHEQLKSQAEQAYQAANYQRSVELTDQVIRQNPRDHVALYLRSSSRIELGIGSGDAALLRTGISDARSAISHGGTNQFMYYLPYLYGMTNLAALEQRKEHAEVAAQVASQVLSARGLSADNRANILYQRAMAYGHLGQQPQVIADFAAAVRANNAHLGAHVGLADAYSAAGDRKNARQAYDSAIRVFPNNPLVFNNRGMFLQQGGEFAEAVIDFTRALEIDASYFTALTNRGFTLMEQDEVEAAENDFTESLQIHGDQPMVYSLRGTARLSQGKTQEALADYAQVASRDAKNPVAHADLGFASFFAGEHQRAQQAFRKAIALDASQRYLNPWLYSSLKASGSTEEAQRAFAKEAKKPADDRDWVDALQGFVMGQIDDAELLRQVNPEDADLKNAQTCEAHFFIGRNLAKSGQASEATKHFQTAVGTNARHLSAFRGAQLALSQTATEK